MRSRRIALPVAVLSICVSLTALAADKKHKNKNMDSPSS